MTNWRVPPQPNEGLIEGSWIEAPAGVVADEAGQRIDWLVDEYLEGVAHGEDGWTSLFRDPADGRYWELSYPVSTMHGGGPPQLAALAPADARGRYGIEEGPRDPSASDVRALSHADTVTPEHARVIAERFLQENVRRDDSDVIIMDDEVGLEPIGWVFPYQTRSYVEEGENPLAGNLPIVVSDSDGSARFMTLDEVWTPPNRK